MQAKASVADDRVHILNAIAGRTGKDLELQDIVVNAPEYAMIDNALRGKFAAATLVTAVGADFNGLDKLTLFAALQVGGR